MGQQNFLQYIVQTLKNSGMIGKILLINTVICIFFLFVQISENLFVKPGLYDDVMFYFAAPGNPADLANKPWSIITQMFTHYGFGHYFFNMLVFYFTARMFVQFFGERRLLSVYLIGGIFAYMCHIGAYLVFPVFAEHGAGPVVGASGSVMAIFMAIAFYRPGTKVLLFGLIPIPLILLAVGYILMDLTGIAEQKTDGSDRIAHFAHIGGAIFGILSVINYNSPKNFMNRFDKWIYSFKRPRFSFKRKPKMKVYQGGNARNMTDEEFNASKKQRQERVDAILDKIAKKGYDGLSKEEKDFLFNESQRK